MKRLIDIKGENILIFDTLEFKSQIEKHMGLEAGKYFEDLFDHFRAKLVEKMEEVIDDFFNEIL